jgi:hypothetical protein
LVTTISIEEYVLPSGKPGAGRPCAAIISFAVVTPLLDDEEELEELDEEELEELDEEEFDEEELEELDVPTKPLLEFEELDGTITPLLELEELVS